MAENAQKENREGENRAKRKPRKKKTVLFQWDNYLEFIRYLTYAKAEDYKLSEAPPDQDGVWYAIRFQDRSVIDYPEENIESSAKACRLSAFQ